MAEKLTWKGITGKPDRKMFLASLILALYNFGITLLMYLDVAANNFAVYVTWPLSVVLLILSFRKTIEKDTRRFTFKDPLLITLLIVAAVYLITHLYNFSNAPWNEYGLFDDGAWDIFDAREQCFTSDRFELIFWDDNIGKISRELVFHYYMSILFRLFGYNMLVFNLGLVFLGFITVLFTTLSAYELSGDHVFAGAVGLLLNFMPLHFTQVFMGHRYAICGPLLMISFYFIVHAFKKISLFSAVMGGVFAGLTMESAVMGKQYIYGLIAYGILYLIYLALKKKDSIRDYLKPVLVVFTGFAVAAVPLYAYMFTHWELYGHRESSLTKEFFEKLGTEGFSVVTDNLKILADVLFKEYCPYRQFSMMYPVLHWHIVVALIIGIIVLIARKKFLPLILAALPFAGSIITITYDFRILIAAPFICITVAEGVFAVFGFIASKAGKTKAGKAKSGKAKSGSRVEKILRYAAPVLLVIMMIPDMIYLKKMADDPGSQFLLPHNSVAVSRYMSDLAAGSETPDIQMKKDEFNRPNTNDRYDLLACVRYSFAHVHAFIGGEYSREILSLCGDFPYNSRTEADLRIVVHDAIMDYHVTDKDLMLAFEMGNQAELIVEDLTGTGLCDVTYDEFSIDGKDIRICRLYIAHDDISKFMEMADGILSEEL
ncbi:MAG: hypothetical protein IKG01_01285 [Lachnospiraceae bacterium]|nr:hypothetical protein [Lachnospiraceae bacterium]